MANQEKKSSKKKGGKATQVDTSSADLADPALSGIQRPLSLVSQVEQTIRTAIENEIFPGGRLPTLLELANQLRVSRETVRLALESLQKEGLVVKRRRRGTFVRIPEVPTTLARPHSKVLGYLLEEFEAGNDTEEVVFRPCSNPILEGAIFEASQHGYQLNMRSAKPHQLRETFDQMQALSPMCGVIFACPVEEKFLKGLSGREIPAILLDHGLHLPNFSSIRGDSDQNASLAIRRLSELGHRRIACVNSQQSDLYPWFLQGYRKGLRDAGIRRRRRWEMFVELSQKGTQEAVNQLLSFSPRPTAIVCCHNSLANQIVVAAWDCGLRVPEDISVVGCGGDEVVNLSCTQLDWADFGRTAVQMLLKEVDEVKHGEYEPEHLLVPYEWREGGTTALVDSKESLTPSKEEDVAQS